MLKSKNGLILSLTVLFLMLVINTAMADAVWLAQSTWDTTFQRLAGDMVRVIN